MQKHNLAIYNEDKQSYQNWYIQNASVWLVEELVVQKVILGNVGNW